MTRDNLLLFRRITGLETCNDEFTAVIERYEILSLSLTHHAQVTPNQMLLLCATRWKQLDKDLAQQKAAEEAKLGKLETVCA